MTLNERIAEKKNWKRCEGKDCFNYGRPHWFRPGMAHFPSQPSLDFTGSLEASDGLLEEIRAKGFAVCFWMHPGGMDELSIWDTDPGICRYQYAKGSISEMSAEAWLAVFGG